MSTKCTIGYGDDWHLFNECFENENVHLILDDANFECEKSKTTNSVRVEIPIAVWREIVKSWHKSYWANHPELDNKKLEFDALEEVAASFRVKIGEPIMRQPIVLPDDEEEDTQK